MGQGVSRRRLLRDAAVMAGALSVPSVPRALGAARKPTVAILGGGVAGLTAAHELAERGFAVTVYERKAFGGKARSIGVPGSAQGSRRPLPGEHGFRFFPGFYHHVPDTMRRIPYPGNPNGVWDNLVEGQGVSFARDGGREDLTLGAPEPFTLDGMAGELKAGFEEITSLPPGELEYFVQRALVYLSSSDERRFGQWEHVDWWTYVKAEGKSEEYKRMLAIGLTRNLVAAKAELASTRTIGSMAEAFIYTIMGRGNDGAPDRLLDAPTNEAWIDPWLAHLKSLGVTFRVLHQVEALNVRGGRVVAARVLDRRRNARRWVEADHFISCMPVERARAVLPAAIVGRLANLRTEWMNGIQFYLRERTPILRGHLSYVDSPWALTSVSQAQFWDGRDVARDYGDGAVKDVLSVDISDWTSSGKLYGRPARLCSPEEIAREVWTQIKAHLEDTGRTQLPDGVLHSWFLDPGITYRRGSKRARNDEPLLVNTKGSWNDRPEAPTAIPNLFLASDYVRTNIDLATMEGANESARSAVNALLDRVGSRAERCRKFTLYRPPEFEALKAVDAQRYRAGRPHILDV